MFCVRPCYFSVPSIFVRVKFVYVYSSGSPSSKRRLVRDLVVREGFSNPPRTISALACFPGMGWAGIRQPVQQDKHPIAWEEAGKRLLWLGGGVLVGCVFLGIALWTRKPS